MSPPQTPRIDHDGRNIELMNTTIHSKTLPSSLVADQRSNNLVGCQFSVVAVVIVVIHFSFSELG
jgi:hypothetical protein